MHNHNQNIEHVYINGLHGRMLRLPPTECSREILIVYGQLYSLERIMPLAKDLNRYGGITVPDLPGFGGMQSFYRIGEKPTIDRLADYLAAIIKMRYKNRRLCIVGVGFGFVVVTRLLQKYPQLANKVDLVISVAGYAHHEDLILKRHGGSIMHAGSALLSARLPAWLARNIFLHRSIMRPWYLLFYRSVPRRIAVKREEHIANTIELWRKNDFRTYMQTSASLLRLDLCGRQIDLPLYHVIAGEKYFNNSVLEQHLSVIYNKVQLFKPGRPRSDRLSKRSSFAPAPPIPIQIRRILAKK